LNFKEQPQYAHISAKARLESSDQLPSSPLPCLFSLPFSPLSYPLSYLPSVLKWDVD